MPSNIIVLGSGMVVGDPNATNVGPAAMSAKNFSQSIIILIVDDYARLSGLSGFLFQSDYLTNPISKVQFEVSEIASLEALGFCNPIGDGRIRTC